MAKNKRKIGNIGEDIACRYLLKNNFSIIDRNYNKRCGEIDIVAKKEGILHFFEVKSINCNSLYRPEDNVHYIKVKRLKKTIETYMIDKRVDRDGIFYFHVLAVYMNVYTRRAKVSFVENVIL